MDKKTLLGKRSYSSIVDEINQKIQTAEAETLRGNDLLRITYQKLNESKTPMLEIKEFITGAEQVASDDTKLAEVVNFCKEKATNGDLNYIINLCKEEHFANLLRSGHPEPEKTIKDIEEEFDEPASIIEQGIRNGIFDKLNSKLLNDVKGQLNIKVRKPVAAELTDTESQPAAAELDDVKSQLKDKARKLTAAELNESYQYDLGGFCMYTPVGIMLEDKKNNRMVILTESDVLAFDNKTKEYSKLDESLVEIPVDHQKLMDAINNLSYDAEKEIFSLNENWDFNLEVRGNGECFITDVTNKNKNQAITKENVRKLLMESINAYTVNPTLVKDFNRQNYLKDADRLMMLLENFGKLYKLDGLRVLRNLNENKYVIFDRQEVSELNNPSILSVNGKSSIKYHSYTALCEDVKNEIGYDCQKLFESDIKSESVQLKDRQDKLTELLEEQKTLNENIVQVRNLKRLAEENSPAMDKLTEQEQILNKKLSENLEQVDFYQNKFELH